MKICRRLRDLVSFPGFVARALFKETEDAKNVKVVTLRRQKKRQCVRTAGIAAVAVTINARIGHAICVWRGTASTWNLIAGGCSARGAVACT